LSVAVGSDSFGGDVPFEGGAEGGQVQVAGDAAELLGRFDHAGVVLGEAGDLDVSTNRHAKLLDPAEQDSLDVALLQPSV